MVLQKSLTEAIDQVLDQVAVCSPGLLLEKGKMHTITHTSGNLHHVLSELLVLAKHPQANL
jgi:hypothetical protein